MNSIAVHIADILHSMPYEEMDVLPVAREMADDILDHFSVNDSDGYKELVNALTPLIEKHYDEAVELVDRWNEETIESETARNDAMKGDY